VTVAANPFEASDPAAGGPYRPPRSFIEAWRAGRQRVLLWGANGMGKSRALEAWAAWAEQAERPVRAPGWPSAEASWWLLDEAQHHPGGQLRRAVIEALERGQGVAIASHVRHRWALRGLDFAVLPLRGLADDAALTRLVQDYLQPGGVDWELRPDGIAAWRRVTGGNVRAALRLGYELYEELGRSASITPAAVTLAAATLAREAPDVLGWRRVERLHRRPSRQ